MKQLKLLLIAAAFAFAGITAANAGSVRITFNDFDFDCEDDIWAVATLIERKDGLISVTFIEKEDSIVVEYNGQLSTPASIVDALKSLGFLSYIDAILDDVPPAT